MKKLIGFFVVAMALIMNFNFNCWASDSIDIAITLQKGNGNTTTIKTLQEVTGEFWLFARDSMGGAYGYSVSLERWVSVESRSETPTVFQGWLGEGVEMNIFLKGLRFFEGKTYIHFIYDENQNGVMEITSYDSVWIQNTADKVGMIVKMDDNGNKGDYAILYSCPRGNPYVIAGHGWDKQETWEYNPGSCVLPVYNWEKGRAYPFKRGSRNSGNITWEDPRGSRYAHFPLESNAESIYIATLDSVDEGPGNAPNSSGEIVVTSDIPERYDINPPDGMGYPSVMISRGNVKVIVPEGYEALGRAALEDLEICGEIVPSFMGFDSTYDEVILRYYVSSDGRSQGYQSGGVIYYKRRQEYLDGDLEDVVENNPGGFYYNSGFDKVAEGYCSNSHEYGHYTVGNRELPGWINEGLVEFTQKYTQLGVKSEEIVGRCEEYGWFGRDWWETKKDKFFPYSDLSDPYVSDYTSIQSGPKWYRTARCFWEGVETNFGQNIFDDIMSSIGDMANEVYGDRTEYFINEVLLSSLEANQQKTEMREYLSRFGFEEGVDY